MGCTRGGARGGGECACKDAGECASECAGGGRSPLHPRSWASMTGRTMYEVGTRMCLCLCLCLFLCLCSRGCIPGSRGRSRGLCPVPRKGHNQRQGVCPSLAGGSSSGSSSATRASERGVWHVGSCRIGRSSREGAPSPGCPRTSPSPSPRVRVRARARASSIGWVR